LAIVAAVGAAAGVLTGGPPLVAPCEGEAGEVDSEGEDMINGRRRRR